MAWITKPDGRQREVKNLGWLVKHWQDVLAFEVLPSGSTHLLAKGWTGRFNVYPKGHEGEALLVAWLKDGGCYAARFASISVLHAWLHRPVFYGLPFSWFGLGGLKIKKGEPRRPAAFVRPLPEE